MKISTIYGDMDDSLLDKVEGAINNDHEDTTWVEYWFKGELVHRSVHVTLREWPAGLAELLDLG